MKLNDKDEKDRTHRNKQVANGGSDTVRRVNQVKCDVYMNEEPL